MKKLFYQPDGAFCADPIPFYENGEYHIFYLLDYRDPEKKGLGTPWFRISTRDFVTFKEHGEMLERGTKDEFDMYVFTGSVIKKDNLYHIFYTGHNTVMNPGEYLQAVMHAVSPDLTHWTKIKEDTFQALNDDYEMRDWRDPFVFYNEEEKCYWMLLSTRKKSGPVKRRGTTALLKSDDLKIWKLAEPFWEPELYYAHECPDLFKIGDWYYQIYSEFSHYHVVRYVMSKSLNGPWIIPDDDMFDGRAFYAAKSVSNGKRRFLIGWNPTKENEADDGHWQWGGTLVTHELWQRPDGTLGVKLIDEVYQTFNQSQNLEFVDYHGLPSGINKINTNGKAFAVCSKENVPNQFIFETILKFEKGTKRIGLLLNVDAEKDDSYGFFLEPDKNRIIFEKFPNFPQYSLNAICVERPLELKLGCEYRMRVIVEGQIAVCYVNDEVALNARMYGVATGKVGLMVLGRVEVKKSILKIRKE